MTTILKSHSFILSLSASALILSGCFESGHSHDDETPLEHACEDISGTGVTVTAATNDSAAPDVSQPHTPYSVQLIDVQGGKGGVVKYVADESTDFIIYLNAAIPLKVRDAAGGEITIEETITSGIDCPDIKAYHTVPLTEGPSFLEFGATTLTQVKLVIEEGGHDH